MSTLRVKLDPRVASLWFDEVALHMTLADGRELSVPLEWFPRLRDASADQRKNWRLIGRGMGIHWEDLDEDLSIAGLLSA